MQRAPARMGAAFGRALLCWPREPKFLGFEGAPGRRSRSAAPRSGTNLPRNLSESSHSVQARRAANMADGGQPGSPAGSAEDVQRVRKPMVSTALCLGRGQAHLPSATLGNSPVGLPAAPGSPRHGLWVANSPPLHSVGTQGSRRAGQFTPTSRPAAHRHIWHGPPLVALGTEPPLCPGIPHASSRQPSCRGTRLLAFCCRDTGSPVPATHNLMIFSPCSMRTSTSPAPSCWPGGCSHLLPVAGAATLPSRGWLCAAHCRPRHGSVPDPRRASSPVPSHGFVPLLLHSTGSATTTCCWPTTRTTSSAGCTASISCWTASPSSTGCAHGGSCSLLGTQNMQAPRAHRAFAPHSACLLLGVA